MSAISTSSKGRHYNSQIIFVWQWHKLGSKNTRLRFRCVAMAFGDSYDTFICIAALVVSVLSCCISWFVCCRLKKADDADMKTDRKSTKANIYGTPYEEDYRSFQHRSIQREECAK